MGARDCTMWLSWHFWFEEYERQNFKPRSDVERSQVTVKNVDQRRRDKEWQGIPIRSLLNSSSKKQWDLSYFMPMGMAEKQSISKNWIYQTWAPAAYFLDTTLFTCNHNLPWVIPGPNKKTKNNLRYNVIWWSSQLLL